MISSVMSKIVHVVLDFVIYSGIRPLGSKVLKSEPT